MRRTPSAESLLLSKFGGCGLETRRYEFADRGTTHAHVLGRVAGAPTIGDIEDVIAELEALAKLPSETVEAAGEAAGRKAKAAMAGPLGRALMAWYRDRIQITAWHPEPRQEEWPPAPAGYPAEGRKPPENVLRTPLHEVPNDAESRRGHLSGLASRNMLHVCGKYCLRENTKTGEWFCRSGYGPESALRQPCVCPTHQALSRNRSAEDALANADPPWCKQCNPDGPDMLAAPRAHVPPEEEHCWYENPESAFVAVVACVMKRTRNRGFDVVLNGVCLKRSQGCYQTTSHKHLHTSNTGSMFCVLLCSTAPATSQQQADIDPPGIEHAADADADDSSTDNDDLLRRWLGTQGYVATCCTRHFDYQGLGF